MHYVPPVSISACPPRLPTQPMTPAMAGVFQPADFNAARSWDGSSIAPYFNSPTRSNRSSGPNGTVRPCAAIDPDQYAVTVARDVVREANGSTVSVRGLSEPGALATTPAPSIQPHGTFRIHGADIDVRLQTGTVAERLPDRVADGCGVRVAPGEREH